MKRSILAMAIVLVLTVPGWAQPPMGGERGMRSQMPQMQMGGDPFSEESFRETLGLSADQLDKFNKLRTQYKKDVIRKRANAQIAEVEFWEQLDQKQIDRAAVEKKLAAWGAAKSDLMMYRIDSLLKVKEILTPDQFQKFRAMTERFRGPMMRGRRGMGGMGMMNGMGGMGMMGGGMGMMPHPGGDHEEGEE